MTMTPEQAEALQAIATQEGQPVDAHGTAIPVPDANDVPGTPGTPPPTPEPVAKKETTYKVYSADSDEAQTLTLIGQGEGPNDHKAIQNVVGETPADGSKYVAIPVRSLRVRTATVVTQPKVVIG